MSWSATCSACCGCQLSKYSAMMGSSTGAHLWCGDVFHWGPLYCYVLLTSLFMSLCWILEFLSSPLAVKPCCEAIPKIQKQIKPHHGNWSEIMPATATHLNYGFSKHVQNDIVTCKHNAIPVKFFPDISWPAHADVFPPRKCKECFLIRIYYKL